MSAAPRLAQLVSAREPGISQVTLGTATYLEDDRRLPQGPMAPFVGRRVSVAELRDTDAWCYAAPDEIETLRLVRAWTVPALIGVAIACGTEADLLAQVDRTLAERCPGVSRGAIGATATAALRKYGFLHLNVAAGRDLATGQPMELELFVAPPDPDATATMNSRRDLEQPARGPFALRIAPATWANIAFPGIGIPLYL